MISFFKKLFAAIFGKKKTPDTSTKPLVEQPIVQLEEVKINQVTEDLARKQADELTKVKQLKESRKWLMRNNRIIIQYNGSCQNMRMNGKKQSMRCTRLERAREIAAGIQSYCVKKIVFADQNGQQFIIKSFN